MELAKPEAANLQRLVADWFKNDTPGMQMELESVFGIEHGVVDATTFLAVAQRIQSKGYEPQPQDDRLSILLQNGLRVSIEGVGVIPVLQKYCRDDRLEGTPYTIMSKSRRSADSRLNIESYDFYVKNRVEEIIQPNDPRTAETLDNWANKPKAFRFIKRWTFKGKGARIDMSVVHSTPSIKGQFLWQKRFQDKNIFKQPPRYEIEVELVRDEFTKTPELALQSLVRSIGEVLRGIQKNSLLIEKGVSERVMRDYTALNKSASFRGPYPVTLELKNMTKRLEGGPETAENTPNVRDNYNVTEKADGLRVLLYCDPQGELFLIDMSMTVYRTGFKNKDCPNCLLDGEWVSRDIEGKAIQHVLVFDIFHLDGDDVSQLPFATEDAENKETRHVKMQEWMGGWRTGLTRVARGMTAATEFKVELKRFVFAKTANPNTIFVACQTVLNGVYPYHTDGLILTPNALPLPARSSETFFQQFKWKPAKDNTIDFLVRFEKDMGSNSDKVEMTIEPDSGESVRYKTLRLFVNSKKDPAYDDPRQTILEEGELPLPEWKLRKQEQKDKEMGRKIRPVTKWQPCYFVPADYPDPMASLCNLKVERDEETEMDVVRTADTEEPIADDSIVEMRYDPKAAPGWRWIPMRIRHDKTERFAKAKATNSNVSRTLNAENTANGVWNSIHNPVTVSMITTGADKPTEGELAAYSRPKQYYNRQASTEDLKLIRGLRSFHNLWVKRKLLYAPVLAPGNKRILDLSCGPGGDLNIWIENKAGFVLGVDVDMANIRNPTYGIYRRYMNDLVKFGREKVPLMVFVQGDTSKRLIDGAASTDPEDAAIVKSVFGKREEGDLPPLVKNQAGGKLRDGADVASCMFALHYFFKDNETLTGFLTNLQETVKVGGYFIGCCTDGEKVFQLLENYEQGAAAVGKEDDVQIWSIRKGYDSVELRADETSLGLGVDVEFLSIGEEHREYLVSFDYLKKRMDEIGFALVPKGELPGGLQHSTNLFENTYKSVPNGTKEYPMSEVVQQYSFLNRWFIFRRQGEALTAEVATDVVVPGVVEGKEAEGEVVEEVVEEPTVATAVAATALPLPDHSFEAAELFQFGPEVGLRDSLKVGEDRSTKMLAPYWPFPIADEADGTLYPSVEHYYNAMMIKHGAKNPDLALTLFSTDTGSIHRQALREMQKQKLDGAINSKDKKAKQMAILLQELIDIKNQMSPSTLAKDYKVTIDATAWDRVKDYHLRRALNERWTKDKMFRTIVEKAREEKKYLLYYITKKVGDPTGELAGRWKDDTGRIEGENKVGKMIMELANFVF